MAGVASGSGPDRRGSSPGWGLPGGRAAQNAQGTTVRRAFASNNFYPLFCFGARVRCEARQAVCLDRQRWRGRDPSPGAARKSIDAGEKGSSRLGGKKAPLGKSCLDPSRSGKRRGEEPQSQENALRTEMQRAGIASSHTAASAHLLDQFHNGAASGANVGSIGYRSAGKIRKSFELDGLRRLSGCLDKVNNPHV